MPADDDILGRFMQTAAESLGSADREGGDGAERGLPRAARRRLLDAALGVTSASRTFITVLEEVLMEQRARLEDGHDERGPAQPTSVDVPVAFGPSDPGSDR